MLPTHLVSVPLTGEPNRKLEGTGVGDRGHRVWWKGQAENVLQIHSLSLGESKHTHSLAHSAYTFNFIYSCPFPKLTGLF